MIYFVKVDVHDAGGVVVLFFGGDVDLYGKGVFFCGDGAHPVSVVVVVVKGKVFISLHMVFVIIYDLVVVFLREKLHPVGLVKGFIGAKLPLVNNDAGRIYGGVVFGPAGRQFLALDGVVTAGDKENQHK